MRVRFRTVEGTAKADSDFEATEGIVVFAAHMTSAVIEVPVLEDDEVEEDEEFFVELFDPEPRGLVLLQRDRVRARYFASCATFSGRGSLTARWCVLLGVAPAVAKCSRGVACALVSESVL